MTAVSEYTKDKILKILFTIIIGVNILTWFYVRDRQAEWANVPPVPSIAGALILSLNDPQFAYRSINIMLQNLGNTGGRSLPLVKYNYEELSKWFFLQDRLDPHSRFTPYLAAYYFGAVDDPTKIPPLIDYLSYVGNRTEGEDWRWLAHAVYLARYVLKDNDEALRLAEKLSTMNKPDIPIWTRQLPAFIYKATGDKKEALAIMLDILRTNVDTMDPVEINFMRDYICNRLLDVAEAKVHPLCQEPIP